MTPTISFSLEKFKSIVDFSPPLLTVHTLVVPSQDPVIILCTISTRSTVVVSANSIDSPLGSVKVLIDYRKICQ